MSSLSSVDIQESRALQDTLGELSVSPTLFAPSVSCWMQGAPACRVALASKVRRVPTPKATTARPATPARQVQPTSSCLVKGQSVNRLLDRVTHGDCLTVLPQMPTASVDFVLTDPPYLVRYRDRHGRRIQNDGNDAWLFPAFSEIYRVLKPDSYCVSFYGWAKVEKFMEAWKRAGFYPVGHFVWVKTYTSHAWHAQSRHEQAYLLAKGNPKPPATPLRDVLHWTYTGNELHPTQKPVDSLKSLIETYCPPGGIVLDPFAGSGTTGAAARQAGRKFVLIEKDPDYHAKAAQRLTE